MEDFRIIYRLLQAVIEWEKARLKSLNMFRQEYTGASEEERDRLMLKLVDAGYVKGIRVVERIEDMPTPVIRWEESRPNITIEGMEYLEENSIMRRVEEEAMGFRFTLQ